MRSSRWPTPSPRCATSSTRSNAASGPAAGSTTDERPGAAAPGGRVPDPRPRRPHPHAGEAAARSFDLTAASAWFPAVGGLVAAVGIGTRWALGPWVGAAAATVAAVLATVAITGAFHEDGLADSADGLWGGATVERRLEIMRDSRLGTYGTTALVGDLGLRIAMLAPLTLADFVRAMLAGHVVGRFAPLVLAAWLPPARPDGQGVRTGRPRRGGWWAAAITVAIVAVGTAGVWSPMIVLAGGLGTWLVGRRARAAVGGITGDLLGAGVRASALLVMGTVVALAQAGAW